jgi:hypothetical protein
MPDNQQKLQLVTHLVEFVTERVADHHKLLANIHVHQEMKTGRGTFVYRSQLYVPPNVNPAKPYNQLDVSLVPKMNEYLAAKEDHAKDSAPLTTFFKNVMANAITEADIMALLPSFLHPAIEHRITTIGVPQTLSSDQINFFKMLNSSYYRQLDEYQLHKFIIGA